MPVGPDRHQRIKGVTTPAAVVAKLVGAVCQMLEPVVSGPVVFESAVFVGNLLVSKVEETLPE